MNSRPVNFHLTQKINEPQFAEVFHKTWLVIHVNLKGDKQKTFVVTYNFKISS
jgi:hypothetical protein